MGGTQNRGLTDLMSDNLATQSFFADMKGHLMWQGKLQIFPRFQEIILIS